MNVTRDDIPKKIGRYEIVDAIGFGAMGAVYKAFDPLIKRTVAIKTLRLDIPPQSPQYKSFIDRFYHEARISGTLSHPNIITLFDIGQTDDQVPFLAMEFIQGETIADFLGRGERFRPEQVIGLVSQMASALDYAHGKGVIHRDIKPSNLIIYDGEKIKITDFGIAKLMDAEMTQGGTLLGTPSYMSPEQAMGETLDGRSDIFSLGVVGFEMLSGQQPFPGNNITSILYKLVHAEPIRPPNLEVLGLLPEKWHQVFSLVLAKNPAERYETAAVFVESLEMCLGSWFGSLSGETVVMPPQSIPKNLAALPPPPVAPLADESVEKTVLSKPFEMPAPPPGSVTKHPVFPSLLEEKTVLMKGAHPLGRTDVVPAVPKVESVLGEEEAPSVASAPPRPAAVGVNPAADAAKPRVGLPRQEPPRPKAVAPLEERTLQMHAAPPRPTPIPSQTLEDEIPEEAFVIVGPPKKRVPVVLLTAMALATLLVVGAAVLVVKSRKSPAEPKPAPTVSVAAALPPTRPTPSTLTGEIGVQTEPEGASVLLNGEVRGVSPIKVGNLPLGQYTVRIEKDGFETEERVLEITPEARETAIGLALRKAAEAPARPQRATLDVDSSPVDANVLIDGKPVGRTPILAHSVAPGRRRVRVQKDGFKPWEHTLELRAGQKAPLMATLEPADVRTSIPVAPKPTAPVVTVREGELVEKGPDVLGPKCIRCDPVAYPELAKKLRREGLVEVSFIITETGAVEDLKVVQSADDILDQAVVEVVKNWKYEPATKKGVRVKIRETSRHRFRMGR